MFSISSFSCLRHLYARIGLMCNLPNNSRPIESSYRPIIHTECYEKGEKQLLHETHFIIMIILLNFHTAFCLHISCQTQSVPKNAPLEAEAAAAIKTTHITSLSLAANDSQCALSNLIITINLFLHKERTL
jgi:hypothetical protein